MRLIKTLALGLLILLPGLSFADSTSCDADNDAFCFRFYNHHTYTIVPSAIVSVGAWPHHVSRTVGLEPTGTSNSPHFFKIQVFDHAEKAYLVFTYKNSELANVICKIPVLNFGDGVHINADDSIGGVVGSCEVKPSS